MQKVGRVVVRNQRTPELQPPNRIFGDTSLTFVDDSLFEIIWHQRKGIPWKAVAMMARKLDMSVDAFITALSVPNSIEKSRFRRSKNLSALAAERVIRAARILKRATEVLESELDARVWLNVPNRALGGQTPLSYMDSDAGFHLVDDELQRIEYGIVA